MKTPSQRIWICPIGPFAIEIIILGEPNAIAPLAARVRTVLESWPGFDRVDTLVMGAQVVGFRANRSNIATHDDPIAEAFLMLSKFGIEWSHTCPDSRRLGVVGTW